MYVAFEMVFFFVEKFQISNICFIFLMINSVKPQKYGHIFVLKIESQRKTKSLYVNDFVNVKICFKAMLNVQCGL